MRWRPVIIPVIGLLVVKACLVGCEGPMGPAGAKGPPGQTALADSMVFRGGVYATSLVQSRYGATIEVPDHGCSQIVASDLWLMTSDSLWVPAWQIAGIEMGCESFSASMVVSFEFQHPRHEYRRYRLTLFF